MSKFFILLIATLPVISASAQSNTVFLSHGKIEFEKTVNVYAQMSEQDNGEWADLLKKMSSHFKVSYFDLLFNQSKSLYRPGRETNEKQSAVFFFQPPAQDNIVFSDLETGKGISQKNIFDDLFLVQDTLRKISWKITTETRNIAGFSCRRANAIIMDSIYVVAFYTDEILTSGGPESFTGLPGMILGVSLPHEHVSWFATKVEAIAVPESQLNPPVKGKKTDDAALKENVQKNLKEWGKQGQQYIKQVLL